MEQEQLVMQSLANLIKAEPKDKNELGLIFIGQVICSPIDIEAGSQTAYYTSVHKALMNYLKANEVQFEGEQQRLIDFTVAFCQHIVKKNPPATGLSGVVIK